MIIKKKAKKIGEKKKVDNNMDKYFNKNDKIKGYSIIKIIGEGRYGIAYLAKNYEGEKCVVKQLKKEMLDKMGGKVLYEKNTLKSLNSPYFPKYLGSFKDRYREGYLLEYVEGRTFRDLIKKENYLFSRKEIYSICNKLLDIVEVLQKNNIVHRDIRTPNVIINKNNELVLIDFGLARFIDKKYSKEEDYWYIGDFLLHLYYTSYEVIDKKERPWFRELDLFEEEKILLKRLMGLTKFYNDIEDIRHQLKVVKRLGHLYY